jgi:hypothetical protein
LCAKKVIEWPRYNPETYDHLLDIRHYFWNMTHGGSMNLTLNETAIGSSTSELTRSGVFSKNAEVRLDSKVGNVLPIPSHPFTHLNWFNMPEYKGDWKLRDDTANISLQGNYSFNVTLHRDPLAMQCLWDGCLHHTGALRRRRLIGWPWPGCTNDHYRYICDAPCNPWAGIQYVTCGTLTWNNPYDPARGNTHVDPNSCNYPYYDAYLKCMGYVDIPPGGTFDGETCPDWTALTSGGCCICGSATNSTDWKTNFVWQQRCISCWTHDRCDYPLVDEPEKKQFID